MSAAKAAFVISAGGIGITVGTGDVFYAHSRCTFIKVGRIVGGALCDRSWSPQPLILVLIPLAVSLLLNMSLTVLLEYWILVLNFGLLGFINGL